METAKTNSVDKKAVRIEFEYDDGSIQTLTGDDAEEWMKMINGVSMHYIVHGGSFPTMPWKFSKK